MIRCLFLCFLFMRGVHTSASLAATHPVAQVSCVSCHHPKDSPQSTNTYGVNFWRNEQCASCHRDLNQRAKDPRTWSTHPLPARIFNKIADRPLSYSSAPHRLMNKTIVNKIYDLDGILKYSKNPTTSVHATAEGRGMISFRNVTKDEIAQLFSLEQSPYTANKSDPERGKEIFERMCKSCHQEDEVVSGINFKKIPIFKTEYIHAYATGRVDKNLLKSERTMPVLDISHQDADDVRAYAIEMRDNQVKKIDQKVRALRASNFQVVNSALVDNEIIEMESAFWKRNHCVHCHDGNLSTAEVFRATPEGIAKYLTSHDAKEIYARLLTRQEELATGVTASIPGMPMTKEPVSRADLYLFKKWMQNGCPQKVFGQREPQKLCEISSSRKNMQTLEQLF